MEAQPLASHASHCVEQGIFTSYNISDENTENSNSRVFGTNWDWNKPFGLLRLHWIKKHSHTHPHIHTHTHTRTVNFLQLPPAELWGMTSSTVSRQWQEHITEQRFHRWWHKWWINQSGFRKPFRVMWYKRHVSPSGHHQLDLFHTSIRWGTLWVELGHQLLASYWWRRWA